jgi:integrase
VEPTRAFAQEGIGTERGRPTLAPRIDAWTQAADIQTGRILRATNKGDRITGDSTTGPCLRRCATAPPRSASRSPRTTSGVYVRQARAQGRAALEQIQLSLGHASVQTIERYLGVRQDLTDAPCDRLGLGVDLPA